MNTKLLISILIIFSTNLFSQVLEKPIDLNKISRLKAIDNSGDTPSINPQKFNNYSDYMSSYNFVQNNLQIINVDSMLSSENTRQIEKASYLYEINVSAIVLLVSPRGNKFGSGTIINNEREIITNWHVVEDAQKMFVWFYNESITTVKELKQNDYFIADVIAMDKQKDLALLKLRNLPKDLTTIKIINIPKIKVAEDVFAIGHPKGNIWSFTYGVVSQMRNKYEWHYSTDKKFIADVIQTQTPTNPGNSGGPLFNENGNLIGVNSFIIPESQGLCFAVRINEVKSFIDGVRAGKFIPDETSGENPPNSGIAWESLDLNEDGYIDAYCADLNEDGQYDLVQFDENQDQTIDFIGIDTNGNQVIDTLVYDKDKNGTFEYFEMDENEDGNFKFVGIDVDGDGIPE